MQSVYDNANNLGLITAENALHALYLEHVSTDQYFALLSAKLHQIEQKNKSLQK